MAKQKITFDDLMRLAKRHGLDTNELFISCANQYEIQTRTIEKMEAALNKDDILCTKEYVKGRENLMANPLIKELPKHTDSANKTLGMMLNIIETLGQKERPKGRLDDLLDE